jgi:hypothetical protein
LPHDLGNLAAPYPFVADSEVIVKLSGEHGSRRTCVRVLEDPCVCRMRRRRSPDDGALDEREHGVLLGTRKEPTDHAFEQFESPVPRSETASAPTQ